MLDPHKLEDVTNFPVLLKFFARVSLTAGERVTFLQKYDDDHGKYNAASVVVTPAEHLGLPRVHQMLEVIGGDFDATVILGEPLPMHGATNQFRADIAELTKGQGYTYLTTSLVRSHLGLGEGAACMIYSASLGSPWRGKPSLALAFHAQHGP